MPPLFRRAMLVLCLATLAACTTMTAPSPAATAATGATALVMAGLVREHGLQYLFAASILVSTVGSGVTLRRFLKV